MKPKKQKDTSHVWYVTSLKRIPWAICDKCGLIRLHNKCLVLDDQASGLPMRDLLSDGERGLLVLHAAIPQKKNPPLEHCTRLRKLRKQA